MNLLQTYLQDISQYPQLSPQEELTLAQRARQGDTEAREQLIHAHLPLVVRVAKIYMPPCDEMLDLIQEGNIGLIKAVDMFDPAQGNRLGTLARFWVEKYILRFLRNEQEELVSLDMEVVDSGDTLLLRETIEDRGSIMGDPCFKGVESIMVREEQKQWLFYMLSTLEPREQLILQLLYGLNGYPIMTREEVAKVIGICPEHVSRLRIKAIRAMRGL